jgi:tetratricopeptide (TPR) repeat protein
VEIESLRQRVAANADDQSAWLQLAGAYLSIDHIAEAAEALAKAVALDGDIVVARRSYAEVLSKLGRQDEAVYQLVQAKRLAPNDARVMHELGVAFYDKGLYQKAYKTLRAACALAPEDGAIRYASGLAQEAGGDMAGAIAEYREAVRLAPELIAAHETLADALAAVGKLAEAVAELEIVLAKRRNNTRAATNIEILQKALVELASRRLLGKAEADVSGSVLVQEAKLGRVEVSPESRNVICYATGLAQLWVQFDAERATKLSLVIPDPEKAALAKGRLFQVTVVSADGTPTEADFATAITLTFLREALGLPLTTVAHLYAELLRTQAPVVRGDVRIGFEALEFAAFEMDGEPRFALVVQHA